MFKESQKKAEISVHTLDGETVSGTLYFGQHETMEGALGKDTAFLEVVSGDGHRKFLSKHHIAFVEPKEPLRRPELPRPSSGHVDAFTMLGLPRGSSLEDAKQAYHRLAKRYHPDNFSGTALPDEVNRYLTDMFRQINKAFSDIRADLQS